MRAVPPCDALHSTVAALALVISICETVTTGVELLYGAITTDEAPSIDDISVDAMVLYWFVIDASA